ncbi:hypothetical protein HRG_008488 [Hirsutella rhossiliensis]|uniref:Uncharacterized protein n=1 Tax=Hirsutella rhossiliensis TaxID=111463 RepID=A0A9P8SEZ4_9HYPO|nr:uncharacterized protein HRG_08488 [Hirsutella rhossiliensis]KAH0960333.1 hypothetical protein HRG_08488 [Hirsutella rhossiliensis]
MAAFEKTGLFPVDPAPVITKILHEQLRQQQPINPAYASLLPSETRFQVAADALNDIRQREHRVYRDGVTFQGIVSDKNSRTQAYANRMKRGKIVRPRGEFITSSSMADITREYEELQAKQTRLQTRQEIRMHLKRVRGEMQKIREDYKVGKKQLVNGRVKTLNFKPG